MLAFLLVVAQATAPQLALADAAASVPATVQNEAYAKADKAQAADITAVKQAYAEKFGADAAATKALSNYLAGSAVATESFMKIDTAWLTSFCASGSAYEQSLAKDLATVRTKIAKLQADAANLSSSSSSSSSSSASASSSMSSSSSSAASSPKAPAAPAASESSSAAAPAAAAATDAAAQDAAPAQDATEAPAEPTTTGGAEYIMGSIKPNQTTQAFIDSIKDDAQVIAQDHDLYASVMIAQAVLESGSGSSGLSANYNNLFGIKGTYQGMSVSLPTKEDDGTGNSYTITATFRAYPTARDSLLDYAELVGSKLYAPAHKSNCTSYVDACNYLQGRYATSTTYSAQLQDLINAYNLTQYDNPVAVTDAAQDAAAADAAASPFHTVSGLFDENGLVPLSAMLPLDGVAAAAIAGAGADAQQAAPGPQVIVGMLVAAAAAVALAVLVWLNPAWMRKLEPAVFGAVVRVRRALRGFGSQRAPQTLPRASEAYDRSGL